MPRSDARDKRFAEQAAPFLKDELQLPFERIRGGFGRRAQDIEQRIRRTRNV